MLVSGAFTQIAGAERRYLSFLKEDSTVNPAFAPGVGPSDRCYRLTEVAAIHAAFGYVPAALRDPVFEFS